MTTLSILQGARAAIASPQNWTRFSRTKSLPGGGYAHCALGALDHAATPSFSSDYDECIRLLVAALTPDELAREPGDKQSYSAAAGKLAKFNNASEHGDVLGLFDRVIASLSGPKTDTGMAILKKIAADTSKKIRAPAPSLFSLINRIGARKMSYVLIATIGFFLVFGCVIAVSRGDSPMLATLAGKSDFRAHADRIAQIYGGGFAGDGIAGVHAAMFGKLKISEDDYLLMGCANSSAARNFPDVSRDDREEGRWFDGGSDLKPRFGNSHGTIRKDGTEQVDSFYTSLPREQYRASPEEVAWHYLRVKELRALNMPQDQRIATIKSEAPARPWLTMK